MFAQHGRGAVRRGSIHETHRATDQFDRSEFGMIDRHHGVARYNLRMLEYFGDRKKGPAGNVMPLQNCLPLGGGAVPHYSFYFGKQTGAMFNAALIGRVAKILRPFRLIQGLAKTPPDAIVGDRDRDPGIPAPEHLIGNDAGMTAVEGLRIFSSEQAGGGKV